MIVLVNGVFDILHAGHIAHLKEARSMGSRLVVALTSDEHVNKGKDRPINTWEQRAYVLKELKCVESVFKTDSAVAAILRIKPDFFVKGIDYSDGKHFTEAIAEACDEVGASLCYTSTPKQSIDEIIRKAAGERVGA